MFAQPTARPLPSGDWWRFLLALSPFVAYLLVFKNYVWLREATGLGAIERPNTTLLPWLERLVFFSLPHRVFGQYGCLFLDIVAAIPYLVHFALPVAFAVYVST